MKARRLFLILVFIIIVSTNLRSVFAQNITGYDLVDAVNALRASLGLEPYQIDGELMAYAQEHSDYQASTQNSTHIHRDGNLPLALGLKENVAVLDQEVASVNIVVYEIWVDWGHRHIMTDYTSGEIGAGVTLSSDGQYYFTIDVRPGVDVAATPDPSSGTVSVENPTSIPISPLVTSQPREDGVIIHKVGYGQTLWSIAIAYGVKINDIRRLNNIADDSTAIYPNQELLIGYAPTFTPAITPTAISFSIPSPTTLSMLLATDEKPSTMAIQTSPIVLTPTIIPSEAKADKDITRIIFLALLILGLAAFVVYAYWNSHRGKGILR